MKLLRLRVREVATFVVVDIRNFDETSCRINSDPLRLHVTTIETFPTSNKMPKYSGPLEMLCTFDITNEQPREMVRLDDNNKIEMLV